MKKRMTEEEEKLYKDRQKINLIRQRKSYIEYSNMLRKIENSTPEDILKFIFQIQDGFHKFGYRKNSMYAYESIEQVIKDRKGGIL